MASLPNLDDDDDFGGDLTGTNSTRRSGNKRRFGDLEDDEEDIFGTKSKVEETAPGVATGMILSHEILSLRESLQECKDTLATCQTELEVAKSEIQALKSSEESVKEQLEKAKKKEAAFIVTVAKREQEISELKSAVRDLRAQLKLPSMQARKLLLDPAIHEEFTCLKEGPMAGYVVAPDMSHVDNTFTFSATNSSTSAAPKARRKKKFKPSPPSRRSALEDFDEKFTDSMKQGTISSDEWFLKFNDNKSTLKATPTFSFSGSAFIRQERRVFEENYDLCLRPESVDPVPPHIKEFCDFALEKYNNENGTSYRYLFPIMAEEDFKLHDASHFFIFAASLSDQYRPKTFTAKIKSFGFSEGSTSCVKELQEVSRNATSCLAF